MQGEWHERLDLVSMPVGIIEVKKPSNIWKPKLLSTKRPSMKKDVKKPPKLPKIKKLTFVENQIIKRFENRPEHHKQFGVETKVVQKYLKIQQQQEEKIKSEGENKKTNSKKA